mgnify:CR=1 FL=1
MAGSKENLKSLFTNSRTRLMIVITIVVIVSAIAIGVTKLKFSHPGGASATADLQSPAGISSVPGALNPTVQYASLQEQQNLEQAKAALQRGSSAIPTIIRTQSIGAGTSIIGGPSGESGVGFATLAREQEGGTQQSLWLQTLKDQNCSKEAVTSVVNQGAQLTDLKKACTCIQLHDDGYQLTALSNLCSCPELRSAGFDAQQLKDDGFSAGSLMNCGFSACELHSAGFSAQDMKDGGFSDGELKGAGYSDQEIAKASGIPDGMSIANIQSAGCDLSKLKSAGVSAAAARRINGCSVAQFKAGGYSALDLKNAGFSAADLANAGFTPDQLKSGDYSARDLMNAGITPAQLADIGYTPNQIAAAEAELPPGISSEAIQSADCQKTALQKERAAGVSALLIKQFANCSAQSLKEAGFSPDDLSNAGFSPTQISSASSGLGDDAIRAAGCDPQKLKSLYQQGVSAERIHDLNGCSAQALRAAGFNALDLLRAGFTPSQLAAAGFTPDQIQSAESGMVPNKAIETAGCDPTQLNLLRQEGVSAEKIHQLNGCNAASLKAAGYDADDLINAGFDPNKLANAGFSTQQIKGAEANRIPDTGVESAGCNIAQLTQLHAQGVSAERIEQLNGCNAAALKAAGYAAKDLVDSDMTPQQLAAAGFTPAEIQQAQKAMDAEITSAGCDVAKLAALHDEGISATHIESLNHCSADAMKKAGYSASDLLQAGIPSQQLSNVGFSPEDLKRAQADLAGYIQAAGCDPIKLQALRAEGVSAARIHNLNGCNAAQLHAAGYGAADLLQAGFTPSELASAGFSPAQIQAAQNANKNAAQIMAAGNDLNKLAALKSAGISAQAIKDLTGDNASELKAAGFDAKDLLTAGFTPQQLLDAGFSAQQLADAGVPSNQIPKDAGVSDAAVQAAGCDPTKLQALRAQGVTASRIHQLNGCSAQQLHAAGYGASDLLAAGFQPDSLLAAGFSPNEIKQAQAEQKSDAAILAAANDPAQLSALRSQGITAGQIKALTGDSASQLKAAGFDAKSLLTAGYTPKQLLDAGFSAQQLADSGVPASALTGAGDITDAAIRTAGCNEAQLRKLFASGVSAQRIKEISSCSASALKASGYDLNSLIGAGFTPEQLVSAGFSPQDIAQANIPAADIIAGGRNPMCGDAALKTARAQGVSVTTIEKTLGCSASALLGAGYNASDLKAAGFTAAELKTAGYSPDDLLRAGYSAKALRDAGFLAQRLKDAGFSANALRDAGFSASDLLAAGFSKSALKQAGFSATQLAAAGASASDLQNAGFTAQEIQDATGNTGTNLTNTSNGAADQGAVIARLGQVNQQGGTSTSSLAGIPTIPNANTQQTSMNVEVANAQKLQDILAKQNQQLGDQRVQQQIQQRSALMLSAANQAMQGWNKVNTQNYVASGSSEASEVLGGVGGPSSLPGGDFAPGSPNQGPVGPGATKNALVKTGDIIFAVLDTSVNTDNPGPILATVVSGQFKGARLIGSFNLPSNSDTMVISFNTMSVPGAAKSTSISAYAIDPNTAETALASRTDHHYLLRYGSLFASSFLEGFGNAFQSANTTVTIGGTAGGDNVTVQNGIGRSALENAVIGLATLGKSWGQVAQQQFNTPVTVMLFSGTPMGILFTQDLTSL